MSETTIESTVPQLDVANLDPFMKGMYESYRTTVSNYLKLKELTAKKGDTEFDSEARDAALNNPDYVTLTSQIEELTKKRKDIYQAIRTNIREEYEAAHAIDPELEQKFKSADELYKAGKPFMRIQFPNIFNAVNSEFGLGGTEASPNGERGGATRRIRGFTFVIGGVTFENATKASKFTSLSAEDFQQAFFKAQGSDDPKEWRTIEFTVDNKEIIANKNAK